MFGEILVKIALAEAIKPRIRELDDGIVEKPGTVGHPVKLVEAIAGHEAILQHKILADLVQSEGDVPSAADVP